MIPNDGIGRAQNPSRPLDQMVNTARKIVRTTQIVVPEQGLRSTCGQMVTRYKVVSATP